jgi:hypothetical protein
MSVFVSGKKGEAGNAMYKHCLLKPDAPPNKISHLNAE